MENQVFLKLYREDQRDITVVFVVRFLEHSCPGCLWNFLFSLIVYQESFFLTIFSIWLKFN